MTSALLFSPTRYTGEFATISYLPERGYQVTLWQFGKPVRYTEHTSLLDATSELLLAGAVLATATMRKLFEEDVIAEGM